MSPLMSNVPNLVIGQRVEASGYFDLPIEDSWSYSNKLVIAMKIDGSYIKSLRMTRIVLLQSGLVLSSSLV